MPTASINSKIGSFTHKTPRWAVRVFANGAIFVFRRHGRVDSTRALRQWRIRRRNRPRKRAVSKESGLGNLITSLGIRLWWYGRDLKLGSENSPCPVSLGPVVLNRSDAGPLKGRHENSWMKKPGHVKCTFK